MALEFPIELEYQVAMSSHGIGKENDIQTTVTVDPKTIELRTNKIQWN